VGESAVQSPPPTASALAAEVSFQAQRGRGPGGQNVNKVASCALLSWDFRSSALLTAEQKQRLQDKMTGSLNSRGQIQLRSDEFRDLGRNKARALEKLEERVAAALFVPKKRRPTRPTKASLVRLEATKTQRSRTKKLRGKPDW
jgi:ribosome-associated protein